MSVSARRLKKKLHKSVANGTTKLRRSERIGSTKAQRVSGARHQQDGREIAVRKATDPHNRKRTYLIYGRSGTGKTTVSASFPKPVLIIDIKDEGDESVSDMDGVDIAEPQTLEEFEAIYWWLLHNKRGQRYKTVVIDTLTQLQGLVVADVGGRKSKAKFAGKKPPGSWGTMTKGDWGTVGEIMKTQIMNFRGLPSQTVFIAQEKLVDPDEGNDDGVEDIITPEVGPAVMKSMATLVCSASSFIGHTFIRTRIVKNKLRKKRIAEYCMRVGPNPVYITKARKPKSIVMPDFVANPTYELISNLAKGK